MLESTFSVKRFKIFLFWSLYFAVLGHFFHTQAILFYTFYLRLAILLLIWPFYPILCPLCFILWSLFTIQTVFFQPLAMNVKETKELIALARSKNLSLMEAVWSRFMRLIKVCVLIQYFQCSFESKHEQNCENLIGHYCSQLRKCTLRLIKSSIKQLIQLSSRPRHFPYEYVLET